jgi:glycosyltransferase involved in cell wall biosynthesis
VIPARDAAAQLPEQLDALAGQDYQGSWELVVVDNESRDDTAATARAWMERHRSGRVVSAGRPHSAGHARNVGASLSAGDFLAFCDADDVAHPGWLRGLAAAAPRADLVSGTVDIERLNDPLSRSWHVQPPRERALDAFGFLSFGSGSNTGVWADAFHALGGFDPRMRWGEDVEFSWRAQLAGHSLTITEEAVMHQRLRRSVLALGRQHFRYGTAGPRLYRDFAGAGMTRPDPLRSLRTWAWLGLAAPAAAASPRQRGRWALELGLKLGAVRGSLSSRVLFV